MATSGSTNYSVTRDDIIKRALRIVGAIGQGETPSTDATSEAALALNEIVKEWQADGMQLWKYKESTAITLVAGTNSYNIGTGYTVNQVAPLKVVQAFYRTTSSNTDRPLVLLTKQEYEILGNKSTQAAISQIYYMPPGPPLTEMKGVIYTYPTPDSTTASAGTLFLIGMYPIEDFDASTDNADFPSYYYNTLAWGLADQLAYEYGVPYTERSMITKKAEVHKSRAMGFDMEEGSVFLMPRWQSFNDSRL